MPWRSDPEVRQWLMILVGLGAGGMARWALLMRDRKQIGWGTVVTDLMVMGVLGLAAKWTVGRLGIEGETTALIAALFALSTDRIVKLMIEWFMSTARRSAGEAPARLSKPVETLAPELDALIVEADRKTGDEA